MDQSAFSSVGIDVGKDTFHIVALDRSGAVAHRARCTRSTVIAAVARLDADQIAMEACGGAHDLARRLSAQGRAVKLLVAADVRAFVRGQKNDYNDAQAIAEAAARPTVRTVGIKSVEQQDVQLLHRMRQRLVHQRTALINQARAMLLEAGVPVARGRKTIARRLPQLLATEDPSLSAARRAMLAACYDGWRQAQLQADAIEAQLKAAAQADERCRRLLAVPGVGVLTATALVAAVGNAHEFRSGRDLAAWLGLVPRQYSTGGVPRLLGISKRGNTYLRWLFVHGGRSVREHLKRDQHPWGPWLTALEGRMHTNKATVAVANKLVRVCWAVLHKGVTYAPGAALGDPTSGDAYDD
jgi:transposase